MCGDRYCKENISIIITSSSGRYAVKILPFNRKYERFLCVGFFYDYVDDSLTVIIIILHYDDGERAILVVRQIRMNLTALIDLMCHILFQLHSSTAMG